MIAIYPGSFDPPTAGHLDIIRRAAAFSDTLYVLIMVNIEKKHLLSTDERVRLIKECAKDLPNVIVREESGLLMDIAKELDAHAVIRGLRTEADYVKERTVADAFMALAGVETLFIQSRPAQYFVSSSMVKELLAFGGDIEKLVPEPVFRALSNQRADK